MKRNDLLEVKALDQKALLERVKTLRGVLADLVIDKHMNKLTDLKVISKRRKDLAQVLTTLRQKQMLEQLEVSSTEKVSRVEKVSQVSQGEKAKTEDKKPRGTAKKVKETK